MKHVLISGAGSGIGRAAAARLAEEGYACLLLGRTKAKLEDTRAALPNPDAHRIVVADVRDKLAIQNGLRAEKLSGLHAVVANAGVGGPNVYGPDDRWDEVLATNLSGVYFLVNESLPYLRGEADGYRHVVVISSILARIGIPDYSAYCASKAGLLGLMRSWAVAFARDRILVNAICPGWVDTDMARQGIRTYAQAVNKSYEEAYKEQMSQVLLRKMSRPEEIANLIAFLLSDAQNSFTGQAFDINNGAFMPA
ncbi:MAG: SDR family oxidoreductase [Calditrichaeota bacterium]|nr:MAG: SDR family oxidoreductase [Calditrichota bacterium]